MENTEQQPVVATEEQADVFSTGEQLARDSVEGWFTFKAVGDKIGGEIVDMFEVPAKGAFKAQRVFTLKTKDGKTYNVGIKRTRYTLTRTDGLQIGDELGIIFEKEIPAKVAGMHPAKSLVFVSKKNGDRKPGEQAKDMKPEAPIEDDNIDAEKEFADA